MCRTCDWAVLVLTVAVGAVRAEDPAEYYSVLQPKDAPPPKVVPDPKQPPPKTPTPPPANPFARALEAGALASKTFNENFDGDNLGVFYRQTILTGFTTVPRVVGFRQVVIPGTSQVIPGIVDSPSRVVNTPDQVINVPIVVNDVVPQKQSLLLALAGRYSGIQIVDNDSPRPTDRVYFGYNFYSNAGGSLNPGLGGSDVQRQMAGFEKTFLDGDASFGMRLPFIQQYGPLGQGSQDVGDLTLIFKYAFYNNRDTGDLVSGGLLVTAPTGGSSNLVLSDGSAIPHSVLLQPWAGFVRTFDRGYIQGISNLIVPTDGRDLTLWGNSLGAGYQLYRNPDGLLTGIVPVAEMHLRTPLSNRDQSGLIYMQDQLNVNGGVHFRFRRSVLSGAVSVPIMGPRPWDIEAMGYFNLLF